MNQFTSHLDFSLTKKRFLMMGKKFSLLRSSSKSAFLIPFLCIIAIAFCTKTDIQPPITISERNPEAYTDVPIIIYPSEYKRGNEIQYFTTNKQLLNGTVNWYEKKNQHLFKRQNYSNGLLIGLSLFDENEKQKFRYEYVFKNDIQAGFRQYGEDDQIIRDWVGTPDPNDSLSAFREWHSNGQVKFEMFASEGTEKPLLYQGLMTLYDEQGNILEQELYKDGTLIEKIK